MLVSLSLLIAAGLVGVLARQPSPTIDAATIDASTNLGPELSRATAIEQCLDVDTEFNLDQLRSSGTLHLLGQPSPDEVYLVISGDSRHAACGLSRTTSGTDSQDWRSVTSFIEASQAPADDGSLSLGATIELRGRVYIFGQVGAAVTTVRVDTPDGETATQIDGGWWGASFLNDNGILGGFPEFEVVWTTRSGTSNTVRGDDLRPEGAWLLCARDESCSRARWTELLELAKGLDTTEQAAILEDRVVTEEEYRGALRRWGSCIAEVTGATVVYDDDGLFTIEGESTTEAFETCQERHASLITEAVGLQGVMTSE